MASMMAKIDKYLADRAARGEHGDLVLTCDQLKQLMGEKYQQGKLTDLIEGKYIGIPIVVVDDELAVLR